MAQGTRRAPIHVRNPCGREHGISRPGFRGSRRVRACFWRGVRGGDGGRRGRRPTRCWQRWHTKRKTLRKTIKTVCSLSRSVDRDAWSLVSRLMFVFVLSLQLGHCCRVFFVATPHTRCAKQIGAELCEQNSRVTEARMDSLAYVRTKIGSSARCLFDTRRSELPAEQHRSHGEYCVAPFSRVPIRQSKRVPDLCNGSLD